jgi:hypothetical protein
MRIAMGLLSLRSGRLCSSCWYALFWQMTEPVEGEI